jgi:hypothetical protein
MGRRTLAANDIAGVEAIYGLNALCAPAPDPMTFQSAPNLLSDTQAVMVATEAQPIPVEYFFELVSSNGTGGDSSSWQTGRVYFDANLSPNAVFTYRVKARNATTLAETAPSPGASVVTPALAPGAPTLGNATDTSFDIVSLDPQGNPPITTYAVRVNGMFVSSAGTLTVSPTWLTTLGWDGKTVSGLSPATVYTVDVKARNIGFTETAYGPPAQITTSAQGLGASAAGNVGANGGGGPFDVLLVNGSAGNAARTVTLGVSQPLTFDVLQPPTSPGPSPFAVFGMIGQPGAAVPFAVGFGIGTFAITPCPASPLDATLFTLTDNFGPSPCPQFVGSTPAPWTFSVPTGIPFPIETIFQGLIFDPTGSFSLSITNAVDVVVQ